MLEDGQLVVDCTSPVAAAVSGQRDALARRVAGLGAQQAQEMVPDGVTVVSALHTVSAPLLADLESDLDEDVLICGDRRADKARVAGSWSGSPGCAPSTPARSRWPGSSSSSPRC